MRGLLRLWNCPLMETAYSGRRFEITLALTISFEITLALTIRGPPHFHKMALSPLNMPLYPPRTSLGVIWPLGPWQRKSIIVRQRYRKRLKFYRKRPFAYVRATRGPILAVVDSYTRIIRMRDCFRA